MHFRPYTRAEREDLATRLDRSCACGRDVEDIEVGKCWACLEQMRADEELVRREFEAGQMAIMTATNILYSKHL